MRCKAQLMALAVPAALAGCASALSGLGGSQTYACKAPEGVLCTSVAGVYANSLQNNLPGQMPDKRHPASPALGLATTQVTARTGSVADASAIRSASRVLRVWLPAWEDSDGDLQDQSYLYLVVDSGRWLIERTRAQVRREFTPITGPAESQPTTSDPSAPAATTATSLPRPGIASPLVITGLPPKDESDAERIAR